MTQYGSKICLDFLERGNRRNPRLRGGNSVAENKWRIKTLKRERREKDADTLERLDLSVPRSPIRAAALSLYEKGSVRYYK